MKFFLGLLLISFAVSAVSFLPYINLLYKLKFQRQKQETRDAFYKRTPIFDKFHHFKVGTPVGGGLLIIILTSSLFGLTLFTLPFFFYDVTSVHPLHEEIKILLFSFISFGLLGLYDDIKKAFVVDENFFGLRLRHKLFFEIVLATVIAYMLYNNLGIFIVNVPFLGVWHIGWWYIPFASLVIVSFTNSFNIADGLDGLASGLLMIALFAFWVLSASILDTPLSVFIAIWIGSLIAFLYFNVYPARIFLGDVGALSFGATWAVIGLILGKPFALIVIGGVLVLEAGSSLLQLLSKRFLQKKLFAASPLHLWLQYRGWQEPKIVMRLWLVGCLFALLGLFIAF